MVVNTLPFLYIRNLNARYSYRIYLFIDLFIYLFIEGLIAQSTAQVTVIGARPQIMHSTNSPDMTFAG